MKKLWLLILSIILLLHVSPAAGQSGQDDIAAVNQQFEEWTKNLAEFVKDVRFDEADVKSFINLAEDFDSLSSEKEDTEEEFVDFNSILRDDEYIAWAQSKGINSETWLKKSMRILAAMIRTEIEQNLPEGQFEVQSQMEQLEQMRTQMGEEAYQQALQAMTAAAAAMQNLKKSYRNLPMPTNAEKALLDQYKDQLMQVE